MDLAASERGVLVGLPDVDRPLPLRLWHNRWKTCAARGGCQRAPGRGRTLLSAGAAARQGVAHPGRLCGSRAQRRPALQKRALITIITTILTLTAFSSEM